MKKLIITLVLLLMAVALHAQATVADSDTTTFKGHLSNIEYSVYINMDFYHNNITVPGQEVFGEMPGYFGDNRDGRKWFITTAEITDSVTARLAIVNDYGSEDLTATLRRLPDGTYQLRQEDGSTLKLARNRKWLKLPKTLIFKKAK